MLVKYTVELCGQMLNKIYLNVSKRKFNRKMFLSVSNVGEPPAGMRVDAYV